MKKISVKVGGGRLYEMFLIEHLIEDNQKIIVESPLFPSGKYYFKISRSGGATRLYDVVSDIDIGIELGLNDMFYCNFEVWIDEDKLNNYVFEGGTE